MTAPADRIEAAAQVLHERRHRAGTAQVCGVCRDDAAAVARVLSATDPAPLGKAASVSDYGNTIRIRRADVVLRRIEPCEACGVELWSRNGVGRWKILGYLSGAPMVEPHSWVLCESLRL